MSCVASCRFFANSNSTMMTPKLSSDDEAIFSTPLMPEIASSIGSITSRSTVSGEAPGYGIATDTTGGDTSGNSSVLSLQSAKMPKTTSASIATTVTMGRWMAKSEMNMETCAALRRLRYDRRREQPVRRWLSPAPRTRTGVPGVRPCAAPTTSTSPCGDAGRDLDAFGLIVAQPELDADALDLAVTQPHHPAVVAVVADRRSSAR